MDPPDLYKLARMRVGERTNKDYEGAVKKFLEWCPDDLQMPSPEEMDVLLTKFVYHIYDEREGGGIGLCDKAKSGIEFFLPQYKGKLAMTALNMQGWHKIHRTEPHGVCPEQIAYLIAFELTTKGLAGVGASILLFYDTYIRSHEMHGLLAKHIHILPESMCRKDHYAVIFVDKGKRDLNVSLIVRSYLLARLLERWKARRIALGGANAKLLDITAKDYGELITATADRMGLAALRITPHTFRYGGATTDKFSGRSTDEEIRQRGRWRNLHTAMGYVQISTLMKQLSRIPPNIRERMEKLYNNRYSQFGVTPRPE